MRSAISCSIFILILLIAATVISANAQTTSFTYQGRLMDGTAAASGAYHMQFSLWTADLGGTQKGTTLLFDGSGPSQPAVQVASGVFTVVLSFMCADCFNGEARWLQVEVKKASDPTYTTLPRQALTSSPYSIKSLFAGTADTATNALALGGIGQSGFLQNTSSPQTANFNISGNGIIGGNLTVSGTLNATLPAGSGNYIQNTTTTQANSSFDISGTGRIGRSLRLEGGGIFLPPAVRPPTLSISSSGNVEVDSSAGAGGRFIITQAGNVGIGTNNPEQSLQVNGNEILSTGSQSGFKFRDRGSTSNANDWVFYSSGNIARFWRAGIGDFMGFTTTGNVGIGTNSPTEKLDVNGNIKFSGSINGNGAGLSNVPGAVQWQVVTSSIQAQSNKGYLANSDSQVTVTLPTNPNIGDVIRVSGVGAGGWKMAQNAGQTVLLTNLGVAGSSWVPRSDSRSWVSIASSADGNKLIAAATNSDHLYTSTDSGETWTSRAGVGNWTSVASSSDGSRLIAAGRSALGGLGSVGVSSDSGQTWTSSTAGFRAWTGVASSADGSKLVAVAANDQIYTSNDSGVTWIPRDSARLWTSVASSADGTKLIATVGGSRELEIGMIYTSTDSGATWTARESARHWWSVASSADGNKLAAAVGYKNAIFTGQIYTSNDSGITWTPHATDQNWAGLVSSADGTDLAAVAQDGRIYLSFDAGANWSVKEFPRAWSSIASSADASKLFAAVNGGVIYASFGAPGPTTSIGIGGYLLGAQGTSIELQYIGNGQFLPISHEGTMIGY